MEDPKKLELPAKVKQQIHAINEQTKQLVSNQERRIIDIVQTVCIMNGFVLPDEISLDENLDLIL